MCLGYVERVNKKDSSRYLKERTGYKVVFRKGIDGYFSYWKSQERLKVGVWLKEGKYRSTMHKGRRCLPEIVAIGEFGYGFYPYGFHLFRRIEDAQGHLNGARREQKENVWGNSVCLLKIRYRKTVAEGVEAGCPVDVAKEMKILEEVSDE